jgi:hypothetical protein
LINNRQQTGRRRGRGGQRQNNTGGGRGPESGNRIDNRARGNAAQLLEKYKTLARDSQQAGDRVLTEYYLQFADHYFRVLSESRARYEENNPSRPRQDYADGDQGFDNDDGDDSGEDDDDFGFRAPQRAPQPAPQQQRPREERPREDRPREDRPRRDYNEDRNQQNRQHRPEQARPEQARPDQSRDDRPRDDRPRDDRPRDDRPRREPQNDRVSRPDAAVASFEPRAGTEADMRPPRRQARPPVAGNSRPDRDDDRDLDREARLDAGVLPPAISIPVMSAPQDATPDAAPAPRKRGRPRKDAVAAPADS